MFSPTVGAIKKTAKLTICQEVHPEYYYSWQVGNSKSIPPTGSYNYTDTQTDRHVQPHTDTDTHAHTNTHGQTQERGMHVHTHTHTIGSKMA